MTARDLKHAFAAHPSRSDSWVRALQPQAVNRNAKLNRLTEQLTIDVTPRLRGRINVAPFRRRITISEMLRSRLSGRSPDDAGGAA